MQKMSSATVDVLHMRNHAWVSVIPAMSLVLGKSPASLTVSHYMNNAEQLKILLYKIKLCARIPKY